jgi:hypothetical protein
VCDFQGSVKQEMDPDVTGASVGTENGYVTRSEGELLQEQLPMAQPSDTNHIQFHGGFLEDQNIHTTQGTEFELHSSRHAISACVCQTRFWLEHARQPAELKFSTLSFPKIIKKCDFVRGAQ